MDNRDLKVFKNVATGSLAIAFLLVSLYLAAVA